MEPRKRKCLPLETKIAIIKSVRESKQTYASAALKHGIPTSSVATILQKEDSLRSQWEQNGCGQRKKQRVGRYDQIDQALMLWFTEIRNNHNVPISGNLLKSKAKDFASKLGIKDFTASNGWLDRFKKRNNLIYKTISGESAAVDSDVVTSFKDKVQSVIKDYSPADIYNVDETGLFFKSMSNKTFALKGETCHGGKKYKDRVTVLLGANMDGSHKLKPLLIGKYKNPRCLKHIQREDLPVVYDNSKNAWMTSEIFGDFLKRFDRAMGKEKRKVLLLLDNCSAHGTSNVRLKNVKLYYLPPNTTSVIQPLDQGIIRSFKSYYHSELGERRVMKIESKKDDFEKVDVREAIDICDLAWGKVTQATIVNCFRKGGFVHSLDPETVSCDPEGVVQDTQPSTSMWEVLANHIGIDMTLAEYIEMESTIQTSAARSDDELLSASGNSDTADSEEQSDEPDIKEDTVYPKMSSAEMYEAVRNVRHNLMVQCSLSEHETQVLNQVEAAIIKRSITRCEKQRKISDYFL